MSAVIPFPTADARRDRKGRSGAAAIAQARVLAGYLAPDTWRGWCARRGLVVEGEGQCSTARLPWPNEERNP